MVFNEYANYYDLIYKNKNYEEEVNYIDALLKRYKPTTESILDLGCGTGKHADLLNQKGYRVHGIDMSAEMLKKADIRMKNSCGSKLSFSQGNVQSFQLGEKFDVITSLFHVMSYQTKQKEVELVFENIKKHMNQKGILIFDCWYGPAVLTEKPAIRVKRLENDSIKVVRIAEPKLKENENVVEVNYTVYIEDKLTKNIKKFNEMHIMRYFFKSEIELLLEKYGFQFNDYFEFMTNKDPDSHTWSVCFIASL